jgi:hypothetical protein
MDICSIFEVLRAYLDSSDVSSLRAVDSEMRSFIDLTVMVAARRCSWTLTEDVRSLFSRSPKIREVHVKGINSFEGIDFADKVTTATVVRYLIDSLLFDSLTPP